MSYNDDLQSNNEELQDILNVVNELPDAVTDAVRYSEQSLDADQQEQARVNIGAVGSGELPSAVADIAHSEYGRVFAHFPSEEEIRDLPNNTIFTVKAYGIPYGETQIASYYSTKSWTRNALRFSDESGATIYVVPISQPVGEIYLPLYGIRAGEENAEANSDIMDTLLSTCQYGATFRFPVGHFWFARPIDVHDKHISILGATIAGYRHINISGTTFLHFTNVPAGQVALRVGQCTIADFTVYGNETQYSMVLDRNEDSATPVPTVNVTGNVQNYGVWASGSMIIRNVGVRNFYYGLWCDTANMMITDVAFNRCHYGLSIGNDIKCFDVFGFDIMVLLQMRGSLASATGVRGDSVGKHLVEITGGGNHTLTDLDADFCMGAIVAIGDGVNVSNVVNLNINGVHGRSGVSHVASTSAAEITAQSITADNAGEFGVIAIEKGSSLLGAVIITNQTHGSNPYDKVPGFRTPFVLLSAGGSTTVNGVQIFTTSHDGNEMTEAWVKGRIASCSAFPKACDVKVYTASGTMNYSRNNGAVVVTDDAKDIYNRMDKSALAMKADVVLTVNGISADENGNVEVVEQEPEVVSSPDEFTDTSKKYVLPDGYIYAYRKKFIPGGTYPDFINQLPLARDPITLSGVLNGVGYKSGVRYNYDSNNKCFVEAAYREGTGYSTGAIPVKNGDVVRINAIGYHTALGAGDPCIRFVRDDFSATYYVFGSNLNTITDGGGKYTTTGQYTDGKLSDVEIHINAATMGYVVTYGNVGWMVLTVLNTTPPDGLIITVNEEISYTVTEDHYEWSWENTGELYVKPDYLGMIKALEERVAALEKG